MPPSKAILDAEVRSLQSRLDRLRSAKDKSDAFKTFMGKIIDWDRDNGAPYKIGDVISQGGYGDGDEFVKNVLVKHELAETFAEWLNGGASLESGNFSQAYRQWMETKNLPAKYGVLDTILCANTGNTVQRSCVKKGTQTCGACKLVVYCSKACQQAHWSLHKRDCKSYVRSEGWEPAWVKEGRQPSFEHSVAGASPLEIGYDLSTRIWGDGIATDTINLPMNEGMAAANKDHVLAYPVSGDLRNVIRTVNELPSDYSGHLTILLSDPEPMVVMRNLVLLMILGNIGDSAQAAELALHLWYSAFLPQTFEPNICWAIVHLVDHIHNGSISLDLGKNSKLSGSISNILVSGLLIANKRRDAEMTRAHYDNFQRARSNTLRNDRQLSRYARLSPSHRLASEKYSKLGLVLPFGAAKGHFTLPNNLLFDFEGTYLVDDMADPLDSWDIEAVISAGKAHGTQGSDIYGCLYFYLSEQIRTFASRLKHLRISFHVHHGDPLKLAQDISTGALERYGLPKETRFDRIDLSRHLDLKDRFGQPTPFTDPIIAWGYLLSTTNKSAKILGHSRDWAQTYADAIPRDEKICKDLTRQLIREGRMNSSSFGSENNNCMKSWMPLYDNSDAFSDFLRMQGIEQAARKAGLKISPQHTIVPHRLCASIDSSADALPIFSNDESWYLQVDLGNAPLWERFFELSRV